MSQDACLLVLGHNDWSACSIDVIRVDPSVGTRPEEASRSAYRDGGVSLGDGPHGFVGVCPGRHVVETSLGDEVVRGVVALYPREAMCLRLDRAGRAWVPYEKAECDAILRRVTDGTLELLHYASTVADGVIRAGRARTQGALEACMMHMKAAHQHIVAGEDAKAVGQTQLASGVLFGASIPSFGPLTTFIGFHSFDLLAKGKVREAWLLLQAGLVLLPKNPTLLATLGEIQIGAGATDDGRANLERALAREAGLDPRLTTRVRGLLG